MRKLRIDFQRRAGAQTWLGWCLLAAGLAAMALAAWSDADASSERDRAEAALRQVRREQARREIEMRNRAAAAGAAADPSPAATPWQTRLDALESAADARVTLLVFEPKEKGASIVGEAENLQAAMAYAARLARSPAFGRVLLAGHETVVAHPRQPARFTLEALWPVATPP